MKIKAVLAGLFAVTAVGSAATVYADINVGVTLSATGPAASLGIPEKNTFALMPTTIGGQKVNYIVLDDASSVQLGVRAGSAGTLLTRTTEDAAGRCVEYAHDVYRADRAAFEVSEILRTHRLSGVP